MTAPSKVGSAVAGSVNSGAGGSQANPATSSFSVTAGNALVAVVSDAANVTGISDSRLGTPVLIGSFTDNAYGTVFKAYYCPIVTTGSGALTWSTGSNAIQGSWVVQQITVPQATSPVDTGSVKLTQGTSVPLSAASDTSAVADNLIFGLCYIDNTGSSADYSTGLTGFSLTGQQSNNVSWTIGLWDKSSTGTTAGQTAGLNNSTMAGKWNALMFAIKGATAAALAAAPAAVATSTAALSTAIRFAATPAGVAAVTAALTTQKRLNATPSAVATATAALTTAIRLAATPGAVASVSATLAGGAAALAAGAMAQATVAAALSTSIRLASAPVSTATATAALSTAIRFATQASGVATLTATLADGTPFAPGRALTFEMGGRRIAERNFKPLLQRVLEARYPRVKPAKERAQRRAKAIEVEAAKLIADDASALQRFDDLLAAWTVERPVVPAGLDLRALFEAQVGFRLRQLQLEQAAHQALLDSQARDEEDAISALLLLS